MTQASTRTTHEPAPGSEWHFAISCFERIDVVSGGIGTYTRLLLAMICRDLARDGKRALLFTASRPAPEALKDITNLTVKVIDVQPVLDEVPLHGVGDVYDYYSFHLANTLVEMERQGHRIHDIEFPDYNAEAYYPLKMKRMGLVSANMHVRLHSPVIMLLADNMTPLAQYTKEVRKKILKELFCYQHCDLVLYGGEAMLTRISDECQRFAIRIEDRVVQVDHPYPPPHGLSREPGGGAKTGLRIGYVGRLEIRKGILQFLETVLANETLLSFCKRENIVFELFGRDTTDADGRSVRQQIEDLARKHDAEDRVVLHGYFHASELHTEHLPRMDGFVFPSRFENYPNALLETLELETPTLVSTHGCMPYLARGASHVITYDPESGSAAGTVLRFLETVARAQPERTGYYAALAEEVNSQIVAWYRAEFCAAPMSAPEPLATIPDASVTFVVPHYQATQYLDGCLRSIDKVKGPDDQVIVVDDGSPESYVADLKRICGEHDAVLHILPENAGPSAARNFGAALAATDLIQFVDSDDQLVSTGFKLSKAYLARNPEVDMVYGILRAFGGSEHHWTPGDGSILTCLEENYAHSAILIRRETMRDLGGFHVAMRHHFEDWQFNCRLALAGRTAEVIPVVTLRNLVREGSRTTTAPERERRSRELVAETSARDRGLVSSRREGELIELAGIYASAFAKIGGTAPPAPIPPYLSTLHSWVLALRRRLPFVFTALRAAWRALPGGRR